MSTTAQTSLDRGNDPAREAAQQAVRDLRARIGQLDANALDLIFREARSHYAWLPRPVGEATLRALHDLVRMGPTSGNGNPARFIFVVSDAAKARLVACVNPGNVRKIETAPVTVIIAHDLEFWRHLKQLHPHRDATAQFADNPARAEKTAFRNGTLQGAYLLLAARALGLDTGPMSGFSNEKVDAEFFAGTSWRSNFLCNLGYADETAIFARLPRFSFEDACRIV